MGVQLCGRCGKRCETTADLVSHECLTRENRDTREILMMVGSVVDAHTESMQKIASAIDELRVQVNALTMRLEALETQKR